MINWQFYLKSHNITEQLAAIIKDFEQSEHELGKELNGNQVLAKVAGGLQAANFRVERGRKKDQKISMPVLYGRRGRPDKCFAVDAYHADRARCHKLSVFEGPV
jgi:hypothetical protein